ncbi:hypothetical protein PLESTB_001737700 [Pleodorina starrii]|uniref:Nudix hydrolase domain-containing protein n=1 Tax=Pleodorina starrii TaxID=330485 RepID=A0A9W6C0K1_9CHLO|nr:hypothetical protein PLESTB_001737700 [Pleodorina starrii]GLC74727.1 hypothetical protein PLESTF_001548900 [Pleodorina starrii]
MGNESGKDVTSTVLVSNRTIVLHGVRGDDSLHQLACKYSASFQLDHLPYPAEGQQILKAVTKRTQDGAIDHSHVVAVFLDATPSGAEAPADAADSASGRLEHMLRLAREIRESCRHAFILLWHPAATEDASMRIAAFDSGVNMVSCYPDHAEELLRKLASIGSPERGRSPAAGRCSCAWCGQTGLTPDELWLHQPLYHIYDANRSGACSVCGQAVANLAVHIHEEHHPGGPWREERRGVGAAVVVHRRRDNKFLMVQEFAGQGYWVPGGATDAGETVRESAVRECLEEAGVKVQLQGLAEVDFLVCPKTQRPLWRLSVFYASLADEEAPPKTVPCFESAGACWVGPDELDAVPLRSSRIPSLWFPHFASGGPCKPLALPPELRHLFKDVEF